MYPERLVKNFWRRGNGSFGPDVAPSIVLCFMPMSHALGRFILYGALGSGGTAYFAAKSDLSTLLEDVALVRPTDLNFVPRIWDMLFGEFQHELDRRSGDGADPAALEAEVMAELRGKLLGGRYVTAMTSSAPISDEMRAWVEAFLEMHLTESYGPTEAGPILVDSQVRRPAVIDYKLADVPDLGYFHTDRPHPRGELLVKTQNMFAGYYKRPEVTAGVYDPDGYYCTGDIVAQTGPDQLIWLDRRNNVLKLSQGEFVAVSKLEAAFGNSPLVRQIYIYGNSARPYLLAVIVPTEDALARRDAEELKGLISESLQKVAKADGLQSYEVPRDFIIELKQRYGERLEQLYSELAEGQANELRELRRNGANQPVAETISRAAAAVLGIAVSDLRPDAHFNDLGGDSLSALTFANLLNSIYDIDVPVGVIVSPATDLQALAGYIEKQRRFGGKRTTFAAVHGRDVSEIHARDLRLDKFIDAQTLTAAPTLPRPGTQIRIVLLTGATGFLGRFLALEWLERLAPVDGKLICLVRAKDPAAAQERLEKTFDSGDPQLLTRYRELSAEHLEVIVGDKGDADLGLDPQTWQRLADTVDLIVDPAALVNHVLPYSQLFGPNVVGTAELIRLALTTRIKPYTYVSTVGVPLLAVPAAREEDEDIRVVNPTRALDDSYANGYNNTKWASEVLLREANDLCGLPVSVFRCDMILTDSNYAGQLNVPDLFTRLMLSLVATGIAPYSFYELDNEGNRQRAHYDGLPVDFIAETIAALGGQPEYGYETFHALNPYDDGIGLDEYIDWLNEAGYPIERIADYDQWLQRFETAMRGLPEQQRQHSVLPLLHYYQQPEKPLNGALASTERFRTAVQEAKVGPDKDIPHITAPLIVKYITDLQLLGLL
jgi:fatty acid CoA ligase FadD9